MPGILCTVTLASRLVDSSARFFATPEENKPSDSRVQVHNNSNDSNSNTTTRTQQQPPTPTTQRIVNDGPFHTNRTSTVIGIGPNKPQARPRAERPPSPRATARRHCPPPA